MFEIQLLNKISPVGLEKFDRTRYTYAEAMEAPDAVMVRSASMHDMELPQSVKAIARAGAGVNNIPCDACAQKGIVVFNTPGANANAVKEMVLLGLLISSRKVADSMEWVRTLKGKGEEVGKLVEKGKSQFVGPEIAGKTLGVIGLGAIGAMVANAAADLGMTVYGYDPYISVDAAWNLSSQVKHAVNLNEIYEKSDYITIHVPCNQETKGMVNASSIATMKNGVRILNFARGELVDTADLIQALEAKKVAAYVTDFPNDDLLDVSGVTAFPHLGASTPESEDNCAKMAAVELMDYLENGNITNSVNLPAASMARSGKNRICIIHKNVPTMLSKISAALESVNIENLLNKSKKDFAYTMIDTNGDVTPDILKALQAIDGVIRIRAI
ncbi:MAG: phosphoglycerate dehydrogenase [Massiliimalia sp.]|jgi:D-3-phosphoglycerate dehydrogenase